METDIRIRDLSGRNLAEFQADALFIDGLITLEDYAMYINDKDHIPQLYPNTDEFPAYIQNKCDRMEIVDNKDNLVTMDLNFFE